MTRPYFALLFLGLIGSAFWMVDTAQADGPADNRPENVRQIPPPGIEIPADDRFRLQAQLDELQKQVEALRASDDEFVQSLLPDVEIFSRAVDQALRFNEMFDEADIKRAGMLLEEGSRRADLLAKGKSPWTQQKGLVVRGFRSKLDDTVQPYGLLIPESYTTETPGRYRCDVWLHGRGERSVELQFIHTRMTNRGAIEPADTIVLHPFGRYSNAFKFAGEVDVLEALEHAKSQYRIDDERIGMRGFSMGGAGCWQLAVHYADRWFAANPGAGFSETPQFLRSFQGETLTPTWWEETLWQWYDCPVWVTNLAHCPTIAYSGEIDIQKQAADVMAEAFGKIGAERPQEQMSPAPENPINWRGRKMVHIIGPQTAHSIHPESKSRMDSILHDLAKRKSVSPPLAVNLVTPTLRYDQIHWVKIHSLNEHWKTGYVYARLLPPNKILVLPSGVDDFELRFGPGELPEWFLERPDVRWEPISRPGNKQKQPQLDHLDAEPPIRSDRSWSVRIYAEPSENQTDDGPIKVAQWKMGTPPWEDELHKRHGISGPIDDAFMDSFLFVTPSGECRNAAVEEWTRSEFEHAVTHWRQQMRGDARVKVDADITEEDIAKHNLILWGDPASNSVMARVIQDLPIQWTASEVIVGERRFDAAYHAPILIFPNPLNPQKYVVLNSSFTYREYDYLNNARQTPKLPDWAVVDLRVPSDSRWPGKIVDADFFNEKWELQPPHDERVKAKR
ncbi:MAG: hypothetical protein KDA93_19920 [Planctomycetaceae bacterium]|nr:hypothetical protein [Planctomycetaceae bacterium]